MQIVKWIQWSRDPNKSMHHVKKLNIQESTVHNVPGKKIAMSPILIWHQSLQKPKFQRVQIGSLKKTKYTMFPRANKQIKQCFQGKFATAQKYETFKATTCNM